MNSEDLLSEKKFYNALAVLHYGDPVAMQKIHKQYDSWSAAWRALGSARKTDPEREWEKLGEFGVQFIFAGEPGFPELLAEAHDKPLGFYYKGVLPGSVKKVSIVGTRKATMVAKDLAKKMASELSRAGVCIISGLAMGIDTAAHEGAVSVGGKTVAVLANSLDSVYPRQNENLAKKILENGGALISEYSLGSETLPHRFLERNRIVSGMSPATIVIEAPEDSGSLVTANLALNQNREVLVVPGSVSHENYEGSHKLIRAGARLVTSAADILDDLGWQEEGVAGETAELPMMKLASSEQAIFNVLRAAGEALQVDKIQEITRMSVLEVSRNLTFLQIKGLIKEDAGRYSA